MKKKNEGITLIALVVTIIALLILAGVSVSMLTGQNGILTNAAKAKESTDSASDLEYLQLKATESLMDYYQGNDTVGEDEYVLKKWAADTESKIKVNQADKTIEYNGKTYSIVDIIGNESEKTKIENDNMKQITVSTVKDDDTESKKLLSTGKVRLVIEENDTSMKAAIPNGFYYVTGKPSTGLVISDRYGDDDNNSKGGNQFVWVPCSGDKGVKYETKLAEDWTANYSNKQWWYTNYQTGTDSKGNGIYSPIKGSWSDNCGNTASVDTYGGFYIARFEAGVPSEAKEFYASSNGDKYETSGKKNTDKYIPVSKKNNQSWNWISQENAKKVSANMYDSTKAAVKSQLVDSYAWDTIVKWMNGEDENFVKNSTDKGNYLNNNTITDVTNGLFAYHLYGCDKKTTSALEASAYWEYATKYQKGKFEPTRNIIKYKGNPDVNPAIPPIDNWGDRTKYEFVDSKYKTNDYDSFYIYKELSTGASEKTKVRNIYDMAGNMWEWTTETGNPDGTSTTRAVLRGGSFNNNGDNAPVSRRDGDIRVDDCYIGVGFRVVLYIQ